MVGGHVLPVSAAEKARDGSGGCEEQSPSKAKAKADLHLLGEERRQEGDPQGMPETTGVTNPVTGFLLCPRTCGKV